MNATKPHKWEVNIGSGNDLVPSGSKPLPSRTKFDRELYGHVASLGYDELRWCDFVSKDGAVVAQTYIYKISMKECNMIILTLSEIITVYATAGCEIPLDKF